MAKKRIIINNSSIVKQTNTELVRRHLRKVRTATRNEIASLTGLSVATSGNILKEMLAQNEVSEYDLEEPNGGRPAHRYKYNGDFIQVACISIFSDASTKSLGYTIFNSFGEVLTEESQVCETITYDMVAAATRNVITEYSAVKSLVVSIPGKIYQGEIHVCDIPELVGMPLETQLKNDFDITLTVEAETDLITLGYYKNHPEFDGKTIVTILAPKNHYLGASIISEDKILRGDHHMAGEVSFISSGFKREDTLAQTSTPESLTTSVLLTTTAIISIINPSLILFTGTGMTDEIKQAVENKCKTIVPEISIPWFKYISDWHPYYTTGVITMALNNTTSGLQLVARV